MFYAYSIKQQKVIGAQDVDDISDTFICLNENCDAELFLKSINGKRKVHFCAKRGKPHIQGCAYGGAYSEYEDDDFIKMPLEYIYNNHPKCNRNSNYMSNKQHSDNSTGKKYIRTPIGLLRFCMAHSLKDEYRDGLTIGEIILNHSNICENANFEGISGLRFVVGNTLRYIPNKNTIVFEISKKTSGGKRVNLQADIILSKKQMYEITNYLINTFNNKFKGHSIAVLGEWEIVCKYHIRCYVQSSKNVVYKFTDETK